MVQAKLQTDFTPALKIQPIDCPKCGEEARIIRRGPDAFLRDGSEIRAFQCDNGHITEVSGQN